MKPTAPLMKDFSGISSCHFGEVQEDVFGLRLVMPWDVEVPGAVVPAQMWTQPCWSFLLSERNSQTQQLRIRENPHGLQPHNVPVVKVVHGPKVGLRPGIWHPCYLVLVCLDCVIVEEPCVQWYICLTNIRTHIHLINIFIILKGQPYTHKHTLTMTRWDLPPLLFVVFVMIWVQTLSPPKFSSRLHVFKHLVLVHFWAVWRLNLLRTFIFWVQKPSADLDQVFRSLPWLDTTLI